MNDKINIKLLTEIGGEYNQTYKRNNLMVGKRKKKFKRFKYIGSFKNRRGKRVKW